MMTPEEFASLLDGQFFDDCSGQDGMLEMAALIRARDAEVRSALLPPGAIVVQPEEARERIARALWSECLLDFGVVGPDSEGFEVFEVDAEVWRRQADAVLAALGGGA